MISDHNHINHNHHLHQRASPYLYLDDGLASTHNNHNINNYSNNVGSFDPHSSIAASTLSLYNSSNKHNNNNNNNNNSSHHLHPTAASFNHSNTAIQALNQVPDLMPSTADPSSWFDSYQQTPRGARFGHNRESSLSSLNSNGPASPYDANTSNPHIAITDSSEAFHDLGNGDGNYSYQLGKPNSLYTSIHGLGSVQSHNMLGMPFSTDSLSTSSANQQQQQQAAQQKFDRGLLPSADVVSVGSVQTKSHPVSVASSTVGGDSQPATPSFQEPLEDESRRRKNGELPTRNPRHLRRSWHGPAAQGDSLAACDGAVPLLEVLSLYHDAGYNNVTPKFSRTITDSFADELFNPGFAITSASPQPQAQTATSPNNGVFAECLALANNQHLSAAQSPVSSVSRTDSPFRHGSPLAPASSDFQVRLNSAQQMREKQKQEQDAQALQEQLARSANQQQQGTPSTISPKDAVLDFNDNDESSNFPLFPPQDATANLGLHQFNRQSQQQQQQQQQPPQRHQHQAQPRMQQPLQVQQRTPLQTAFDFPSQLPQQYPFISRPRPQQQQIVTPSSTFSRMSSTETSGSNGSDATISRPARTMADGGTYTCTYHGCTLRFETPQALQKHKREGHRQANGLATTARPPVVSTAPGTQDVVLGSQQGPHKCDRINPSTGKPCNTIFSRPYDLTRHEDTIHNNRKKKVRCDICTEEKTFSRADALTRHYRVVHPDREFPGKHRKRVLDA
ncbi:hypothetical protein KJ359_002270 [Pestalotiopsis sp. 9143b]|nr:hypothetical protein KJ359_002270 [Pestalotiopsis sp. 9143b]